MSAESVFDEIREALNGRPGQPIVLGVCRALAQRFEKEPWTFRLAAIVMGVFWTIPTLLVYVILGFALKETEARTRGFFAGLCVIARETTEKLLDGLRGIFGQASHGRNGY
jgi:phage shock protein PspC (stress-responsive transcriptional regulator)